jgi:peptidoglycan hydrolase-like protein with peptidoglycan-binding domain
MQDALNQQGIAVTANGVLDDETRAAIRQYQSQHDLAATGEPDKATLDKLGVGGDAQATGEASPGQAMGGTGPGMGMMTPDMMQMMQRMMGGMGPGTMGQGQMPMARGMMMCPMMQMMMGARSAMEMPGMMGGLGMPDGTPEEMTPERVRTLLEQRLTQEGNPRLKLGEIATAADGSITAEIVTVDGSLVQKLAFNRYPGLVRQITE